MTEPVDNDAKVQKPSAHFVEPHDVVVDPLLSGAQKVDALVDGPIQRIP